MKPEDDALEGQKWSICIRNSRRLIPELRAGAVLRNDLGGRQ